MMGCQTSTFSSEFPKQKITIGYWAFPYLAQPIRYLLELTKIPYQENLYFSNNNEWTNKDKNNLGLDYPNLPYLIQGDFNLTESLNIVNYIIDYSGQNALYGKGQEKYNVENIRYLSNDLLQVVFKAKGRPEEEIKTIYENEAYKRIKYLQKSLNGKVQFFSELTVADIYFYSFLSFFKFILPDYYREFSFSFDPVLNEFESISQIRNYQSSDQFKKIFPSFVPTKKASKEKIVLGYWALNFIDQPIRYILELGEVNYQDQHYEGSDWFENDKQNLGLDYPNLPYLIQGELKITESQNIVNYIVEEINQQSLFGDLTLKYEVNNIAFSIKDLLEELYKIKNLSQNEQRLSFNEKILPKFSLLIKNLGDKKQFFKNLTIADVFFYTLLKNIKLWTPQIYKEYEYQTSEFLRRFESIPQIERFHKSDRYSKLIQQSS